jgi:ADP-heptose:LPS heptosyltransferase
LTNPGKILVIRLSSLGDIILTFPLLYKLRRQFPDAKVDFVTKPDYHEAVELCGIPDDILLLDKSLSAMRSELKRRKYDLIIDLHKNLKSVYLKAFNCKKIKTVRKDNFKKFLLVNGKINLYEEPIPVYLRYVRTVELLEANQGRHFESGHLQFKECSVPEPPFVVIAPGSRHFTKTFPAERFAAFIETLTDVKVVLVGSDSQSDMRICNFIASRSKSIMNLCGKLKLSELVHVINLSELVFSNDSAVMHLAEAAGKRVAAIFGNTVEEFGFFPQLKNSMVMEVKGLSCRPCSHIGLAECPTLTFDCMMKQNIDKHKIGIS